LPTALRLSCHLTTVQTLISRITGPKHEVLLLITTAPIILLILRTRARNHRHNLQVAPGIVRQLSAGIESQHFQVAERCLCLWGNEHLAQLVRPLAADLVPLIFPALHKHSREHWNRNTLGLSFSVLSGLMEQFPEVVERCNRELPAELLRIRKERKAREEAWAKLEQQASKNPMAQEIGGLVHPAGVYSEGKRSAIDVVSVDVVSPLSKQNGGMEHRMLSNTKMRRKSFLPRDE